MGQKVWLQDDECERSGGLPHVCMVCGVETDETKYQRFVWSPRWTYWLLLLGVIWCFIAQLITRKSMTVYAPLCHNHRWHWTWKTIASVFSILAIIAFLLILPISIAAGLEGQNGQNNDDYVGYGFLGGAVISLVILIWLVWFVNRGPRVLEITERDIHFGGVAPEFVEAVEHRSEQ